jgi:hypothetical protein
LKTNKKKLTEELGHFFLPNFYDLKGIKSVWKICDCLDDPPILNNGAGASGSIKIICFLAVPAPALQHWFEKSTVISLQM